MKKKFILVSTLLTIATVCIFAQDKKAAPKEKDKDKKSILDKVSELPDALIAQKEKVDTNAGRFIQDILSVEVPPLWKEKGSMLLNDLKLPKADKDPLVATLPLPEKKVVQEVVLTLNTIKKTPADKKNMLAAQVKTHIMAFNKEMGKTMTGAEIAELVSSMFAGPESFTTKQGRTGELYLVNDIQAQQAAYVVLLIIPGTVPNTIHFAQFQFIRFIYETAPPDDMIEWRTFVYPDEQQTYVDFAKDILKTLVIK